MPVPCCRQLVALITLIIKFVYVDGIDTWDASANFVPFCHPGLLGHHNTDHAHVVSRSFRELAAVWALFATVPLFVVHDELALGAG